MFISSRWCELLMLTRQLFHMKSGFGQNSNCKSSESEVALTKSTHKKGYFIKTSSLLVLYKWVSPFFPLVR